MNEWIYLLAFSLLLWPWLDVFSTSTLPKHQLIFHGDPGAFSDVGQFCAIPISQKRKLLPFSIFHSRRTLLRAQGCPVLCGFQGEPSPSSFALWSSTLVCCSPGGGERPSFLRGVSSSSLRLETERRRPSCARWGRLSRLPVGTEGTSPSPATSGAPDPWGARWPCARPLGPLCGQPGLRALVYVDGW